ncbi:MAG: response regulator [Ferruginibacter sp.]
MCAYSKIKNEPFIIFLADDDETDRLIFSEAFEEIKIQTSIRAFNDGVDLMNYLNTGDTLPHLLFLDLNMPKKNGLQCLKEIKANKKFQEICIAIYSTSSSEVDIESTFREGANVYIKKPDDFNVLKSLLEKAVMVGYQYQHPPFNKENFLLRI